ncbi:MAG: SAM-dependent methyltransferase, partial [Planctomycetota bacterium]
MSTLLDLVERGWVPDPLVRVGIRRLLRDRIRTHARPTAELRERDLRSFMEELENSPIALHVDAANEQHYEVPSTFFKEVLGENLKYSSAWWPRGVHGLDEAEAAMLALTCARARLQDGQEILELGCGWGSLTLWMAEHYPNSRITGVSNSSTQREWILARCRERGLENVEIRTVDMNDFETAATFDRVVSIEMFEHMRNYRELLQRVSRWLRDDGRLF